MSIRIMMKPRWLIVYAAVCVGMGLVVWYDNLRKQRQQLEDDDGNYR